MRKTQQSIHKVRKELPPLVLTIFGATGDLALDYLLPSLLHMDAEGLLPSSFHLVCVGRRAFDTRQFLDFVVDHWPNLKHKPAALRHFARHVQYFQGDFDSPGDFKKLAGVLDDEALARHRAKGDRGHECFNRLYYFATAPQYFEPIAKILKTNGLLIGCTEHQRTIRILVEKPFGSNLVSARKLNKLLLRFFSENQIYRIDHYLGKETVQNLMVMRFANDFLEPVWNSQFIDHVEISALESEGVGNRINFYEKTGAIKDFAQNHLLHMLALIAMDRPKSLDPQDIRDNKVKVLKALRPYRSSITQTDVLRGQYIGYEKELGRTSSMETVVAIKALLNLPRWNKVPFYLRTGKRMNSKVTEISIHFKKQNYGLFSNPSRQDNVLCFRIQPDEKVSMLVNNKVPGFGINLKPTQLEFGYKEAFMSEIPGAYERLLLDFMEGDQRLFLRSDEIEAAWRFIDSITKNWQKLPLHKYRVGQNGPKALEIFMTRSGRQWWTK